MNNEAHINELSERLKQVNGFSCLKCDYAENEICVYAPFERFNSKHFKLPKKKVIDLQWLLNKCAKMDQPSTYENLQPIFEKLNLDGNFYYTSFGFSFSCIFTSEAKVMKNVQPIKDKLNELGIVYKCEFSDASWVYRFKISTAKDNIERIKNI